MYLHWAVSFFQSQFPYFCRPKLVHPLFLGFLAILDDDPVVELEDLIGEPDRSSLGFLVIAVGLISFQDISDCEDFKAPLLGGLPYDFWVEALDASLVHFILSFLLPVTDFLLVAVGTLGILCSFSSVSSF